MFFCIFEHEWGTRRHIDDDDLKYSWCIPVQKKTKPIIWRATITPEPRNRQQWYFSRIPIVESWNICCICQIGSTPIFDLRSHWANNTIHSIKLYLTIALRWLPWIRFSWGLCIHSMNLSMISLLSHTRFLRWFPLTFDWPLTSRLYLKTHSPTVIVL